MNLTLTKLASLDAALNPAGLEREEEEPTQIKAKNGGKKIRER